MIIDRYIITEVIRPFSAGMGLLVLIFAGYSSAIQLADAAAGQIQVSAAASLVILKTLAALETLLPTALYLSVTAAISRLQRDSEIIALKAAGISEIRILYAVFKLAIVAAFLAATLSLFVRPWAYRESYRIEDEATTGIAIESMEPGRFHELLDGSFILFSHGVDSGQNRLKEVFLKSRQNNRPDVIYANEALLRKDTAGSGYTVEFSDGYRYLLDLRGNHDVTLRFESLTLNLQGDGGGTDYRRKAQPTRNLVHSNRPRDIAEYQWRVSTPLATLLLALLAVPLARCRRGHRRFYGFFIAILVYVAVFNIVILARNLVEQGHVGPFPGLWWAYGFPAGLLAILVYGPHLHSGKGGV